MKHLFACLDMPPSGNHLYFNNRYGGRTLTREGEAWRNKAEARFHEGTDIVFQEPWDLNVRYSVRLTFHFKNLENAGWHLRWKSDSSSGVKKPHKKGDRKAMTRWGKLDADNRLKATLDALKRVVGVDDSAYFPLIVDKDEAPDGRECVIVEVKEVPWESTRIPTTS